MEQLEPTRRDTLPEYLHYSDKGCHVNPSCLDCDLPACIYDEGVVYVDRWARNQKVLKDLDNGDSAKVVAERYGIGERTVFRIRKERKRHQVPMKTKGEYAWPIRDTPGKPVTKITNGFTARKPRLAI